MFTIAVDYRAIWKTRLMAIFTIESLNSANKFWQYGDQKIVQLPIYVHIHTIEKPLRIIPKHNAMSAKSSVLSSGWIVVINGYF